MIRTSQYLITRLRRGVYEIRIFRPRHVADRIVWFMGNRRTAIKEAEALTA